MGKKRNPFASNFYPFFSFWNKKSFKKSFFVSSQQYFNTSVKHKNGKKRERERNKEKERERKILKERERDRKRNL